MKSCFLFILYFSIASVGSAQQERFEQWKIERQAELIGENGWINLVELIWMNSEKPYLEEIDLKSLGFSKDAGEATLGKFEFGQDSVWFVAYERVQNDSRNALYEKKKLAFPTEYGPSGLYYKNWKWSIIKRGKEYAFRLRDLKNPKLQDFTPTPTFDYNSTYRFQAKLLPRFNQTLDITNVLGQLISWKLIGVLQFEYEGNDFEILVLDELGKLFVLFSDDTSASQTYPTGRYLYVDPPGANGMTLLDFNFGYNPPCAYTEFATCPIPPRSNRLPFSILAGEKMPEGHK
ncbi:MAG: DUF1684 domain-containing protein [Bacteroidetes bacterium]|nr:DUF1684 domain-containing protein [Bacteroidota bacterium]MDA1268656.1 DUF1684 domain-containing protein [Bacteroidota bacterium]